MVVPDIRVLCADQEGQAASADGDPQDTSPQHPRAICCTKHRLMVMYAICSDTWSPSDALLCAERRIPKLVQLRDKDGTSLPLYEGISQYRRDVQACKLQLPRAKIPPVTRSHVLAYSYHSWNDKATLQQERSTGRLCKPQGRDVCLPKWVEVMLQTNTHMVHVFDVLS